MSRISKREQILATAGELFLRDGYSKVSMDGIAAAVPVSKPTLYNNFKDKKTLYAAVISECCEHLLGELEAHIDEKAPPETVLSRIGESFLCMALSSEALQMHRIVASECADFPDMAKLFYESGPKQTHGFLTRYLERQHKVGRLQVENPPLSAGMFLSMLKGHTHMQCLLGLRKKVSAAEQKTIIAYAVKLFVAGHAPSPKK